MRKFYTVTDSTLLEVLSQRDQLGQALRKMKGLTINEPFSVDILHIDTGKIISHFEYL